jgi:hypothetical protein
MLQDLPTRQGAEKWVRNGRGQFGWPDANDFIYRWNSATASMHGRISIAYVALMINMVADNMVPIELGDARKVAERLKNATYLEVKEKAKYGHGARGRTVTVWGPKLREWLRKVRPE